MEDPKIVDQIVAIPLKEIIANEDANCRDKIDPLKVLNLWRTIERDGLLQPIVVRKVEKGYELICGYRRYKAHVVGCATTINAKVIHCDDRTAKVLNLIENLERQQLNLLEEAKSVQKLMFVGWTLDKISKRFGVSNGWVRTRVALMKMPEAIQQEAAAGFLKMGHIDALEKMCMTDQYEMVKQIKEKAIRGEKTPVAFAKAKVENHIAPKRVRTKDEIGNMLSIVAQKLDFGIETRLIAWTLGNISTDDLLLDIEKESVKTL